VKYDHDARHIKEEPDRIFLPVPLTMNLSIEESLSVHRTLPDLLKQAGNHLIRRHIIHIR